MDLEDSHLLAFMHLCNLLPLNVGWTQWLASNKNNAAKVMASCRLDYKKTVASSCLLCHILSLGAFGLEKASYHMMTSPIEGPMWQKVNFFGLRQRLLKACQQSCE